MKVLMDGRPVLRPWYGGVPQLVSKLIEPLRTALGTNELMVAATGFDPLTPQITEYRRLPNKLVAALTWTGLSSFDRLFTSKKPDVLFLPNLEFVGRPKLPYALLVHDLSFLIEPRWFNWKMRVWHKVIHARRLMREANHLFTVSETTKRDLTRLLGIPADRITVITLGLDLTPPSDATRYSLLDTRYILCLGASNHRKNTECVIAAHAELIKQEKYKDVKLVATGFVGATRRVAPTGIMHVGHPSYPDLFALMRDAAVFCYPSWYEGFGMPLHEAARFGTPCIASTAGALPETAPTGTRFASPAKPHHWVEAICQALDNRETHRTHTNLGSWDGAGLLIAKKLQEMAKA